MTEAEAPSSRSAVVWGCVICFHPEPSSLSALLERLAPQVSGVVLIDNSPQSTALTAGQLHGALHVRMPGNAGTAGGLNEAWRHALRAGATHLVSFDQDSLPDPGFVASLLDAFMAASRTARLAAMGPVWNDKRNGTTMRVLRPVAWRRRHAPAPVSGWVEVDHLITSGCLTSAEAYQAVGPFDEGLFLDYVDVEWSLRARHRGWTTAVAASCTMSHAIGDDVLRLGGRQLALHGPARSYLQVRNHLLLWRRRWIPRGWLVSDMVQTGIKIAALLVLAPKRLQRAGKVLAGFFDGIRGHAGPLSP